MYQLLYVLTTSLSFFIDLILLCMFVSAVLSWIVPDDEYRIVNIIHSIAEIFVYPVRLICDRMNWFQGFPIDIPFLITLVLLNIINTLLML